MADMILFVGAQNYSPDRSIWVPALYFDVGFVDSYSACYCSCNGWHLRK